MKKALLASAVLVLFAVAVFGYSVTRSVAVPEASRIFVIAPGESVMRVSANLRSGGIAIRDFWFRTYVWLVRKEGAFLAGSFELPSKASIEELVHVLTTKGARPTRTIKILEGWGIPEIAAYFEKEGLFRQEDFIRLVGAPGAFATADNDFYNELVRESPLLVHRTAAAPLEGFLFPDTYEIFASADVGDAVRKMAQNFDAKVTQDLRDEVARQGKNFYKVLIMASIIEAEVPHEEDRAIVSDIFWSRLAAGVPLQSDATLNYIIGGDSPALTSEQLKINSVYNTYKYRELPPTPIGNPGLSAIRAAIYPADTDYFYFLSTPEGETIFSRTLEEHNAAKARYLR